MKKYKLFDTNKINTFIIEDLRGSPYASEKNIEILDFNLNGDDKDILCAIALNKNLTLELQRKIAFSNKSYKYYLLYNPSVHNEILEFFFQNEKDFGIRMLAKDLLKERERVLTINKDKKKSMLLNQIGKRKIMKLNRRKI